MTQRRAIPEELREGPITLVEAMKAGLARQRLQNNAWRRLSVGTYACANLVDGPLLVLAAIRRRLPEGSVFSGLTAAWVHGLDLPFPDPVEVTVAAKCGVSSRAGLILRRAGLPPEDVVVARGLPATAVPRTLSDLVQRLPLVEAVVVADMALHMRRMTMTQLFRYIDGRAGWKGVAGLRRVLELAEPKSESAMETRLRLLLQLAGLPRPEAQVCLRDEYDRFVARADLFYPERRLCIEYDGGTHRESLVKDNRRQNRLLSSGFNLLRFTAADVISNPDSVVAQVRSALQMAAGPRHRNVQPALRACQISSPGHFFAHSTLSDV